ncbi:MAG: hypothetical protein HQL42_15500 [Alphaproteobacteria bacterium]|nr:hypothetical protein [Alphaproteobacteria bacterium]
MDAAENFGFLILAVDQERQAAEAMVAAIRTRTLMFDGDHVYYLVPDEHQPAARSLRTVVARPNSPDGLFDAKPIKVIGTLARLDPLLVQVVESLPQDQVWRLFNGGCICKSSVEPSYPDWVWTLKAVTWHEVGLRRQGRPVTEVEAQLLEARGRIFRPEAIQDTLDILPPVQGVISNWELLAEDGAEGTTVFIMIGEADDQPKVIRPLQCCSIEHGMAMSTSWKIYRLGQPAT